MKMNTEIFCVPGSDNMVGKLPIIMRFLILTMWVGLIYASYDTSANEEFTFLQNLFIGSMFGGRLLQIIIITTFLYIGLKYTKMQYIHPVFKTCIAITAIVTLVSLLNPYNNLSVMEYLYGAPLQFYTMLMMLFILLSMNGATYAMLIKRIFILGGYVALLRSVQALFMLSIGKGALLFGMPATIIQGDTLWIIGLFHVLAVGAFFTSRRRLYLYASFILLLTLLLSFRRSTLFVSLLCDVSIITYYYYRAEQKSKASITVIMVATGFVALPLILLLALPEYFNEMILKYLGVLNIFSQSAVMGVYGDSGHFMEAWTTMLVLLENLNRFWGAGYGNAPFYVFGQTGDGIFYGAIHNSFVHAWAQWGLYMTIYLLYLLLISLYLLVKFVRLKTANYVAVSAVLYLTLQLVNGWLVGYTFLRNSSTMVLFVLLFSNFAFCFFQRNIEIDSPIHESSFSPTSRSY